MKKLTFLFFCIVALFLKVNAQESIKFSKVIQAEGMDKTALFVALNDWFATNYNSAQDVLQMSDKEAGVIIGKGNFDYTYGDAMHSSFDGIIKYTIKVYVKDNRYKVDLMSFNHEGKSMSVGVLSDKEVFKEKGSYKKYYNRVWVNAKEQAEQYANGIYDHTEKTVNSSAQSETDDDW